jgi:type IV pilus assembly protein PilM
LALFKKRNLVLGIDISHSAVKLLELSRSGQRYRVEAMAFEPLPGDSMEDRNPADLDQVGAAIKRALKLSGTRLKQAAVAVPTSSVIIRTIPMPLEFNEDEIEANIQLDASQYIPFPLEEIYMDFQMVPGSAKAAAGTQEVMLVASRQENVELRRDVLQDAGLKTVIVDVEAYALENTSRLLPLPLLLDDSQNGSPARGHDRLIALVDIGTVMTTLYVLQGDKVIFTREQSFGGEQLTLTIAEAYGLSRENAELAKKHPSELPEDYVTGVLAAFQQSAAEQINQALQFFFSSDHLHTGYPMTLAGIVLAGGGAITSGLDQAISEQLGIPTVLCNPFMKMESSPRVNRQILLRDAPLFAVACGLALRSFD